METQFIKLATCGRYIGPDNKASNAPNGLMRCLHLSVYELVTAPESTRQCFHRLIFETSENLFIISHDTVRGYVRCWSSGWTRPGILSLWWYLLVGLWAV